MFNKLSLAATLALTHAKSVDKCPEVSVVQNLDSAAYSGEWFEALHDSEFKWNPNECNSKTFNQTVNGNFNVA